MNMAKPVAVSDHQGTINCGILVAEVGGSGNPSWKWEEMGERERKELLLFA